MPTKRLRVVIQQGDGWMDFKAPNGKQLRGLGWVFADDAPAANSHDDLVAALKAARGAIFENEHFADIAEIIDTALAKAGAA